MLQNQINGEIDGESVVGNEEYSDLCSLYQKICYFSKYKSKRLL